MSGLIDYYARRRRAQADKRPEPVKYPSWDPTAAESNPETLPPEATAAASAPTNGHVRNVRPVPRSRRTAADDGSETQVVSSNGNDPLHENGDRRAADSAGPDAGSPPTRFDDSVATEDHAPARELETETLSQATEAYDVLGDEPALDETSGDHATVEPDAEAAELDHVTRDEPAPDHAADEGPALEDTSGDLVATESDSRRRPGPRRFAHGRAPYAARADRGRGARGWGRGAGAPRARCRARTIRAGRRARHLA